MQHDTWQSTKDGLYQHFTFADFKQAFEFMTRVADIAEGLQHHPRWTNNYNNVEIWLATHSAGGEITGKDHELAAAIDAVYQEFIV
jgi:4a-hydroxytetrahydrobiopterin dehydratase